MPESVFHNFVPPTAEISTPFRREFQRLVRTRHLSDNETLIVAGSRGESVYLLYDGVLRSHFRIDDVEDRIVWFYMKGDLVQTDCLDKSGRSRLTYTACGSCRLYELSMDDYLRLKDQFPEFLAFCQNLENEYSEKTFEYVYYLLRMKDNERYSAFLEKFPGLVIRAKGKHIASFLNVHENTLSRMKKSVIPK